MRGGFEVGNPRVEGVREGNPGGSGGDLGEDFTACGGAGEQWRGHKGGIDERFGKAEAPAFDRDQRRIEQAEAKPAGAFGDAQAGQAHVDEPLPDRRVAVRPGVEAAQHVGAVRAGEIGAHRIGKFELVGGEQQVHQPAPTRGRPSRRSAVILRWISFDPA